MIDRNAACVGRNALAFSVDVQGEAARSLELLRAIDDAVEWLNRIRKKFEADTEYARATIARVNRLSPIMQMDLAGAICIQFERAQSAVCDTHAALVAKRDAARSAPELREDDGVVDAYDGVIEAAINLHDALDTLRLCMLEHDADCEKGEPRKTYSVDHLEELFADLAS